MCYVVMHTTIPLAALAVLAVLSTTPARAACRDDADALASKYGVTDTLTQPAQASTAAKNKTLAETGGVIAPPATGDAGTIAPPADVDAMKTAPGLAPQTADGGIVKGGKTAGVEGDAAASTQAASLLQAARHAGASGDEATCRQRLGDARALLQKAPTASQ